MSSPFSLPLAIALSANPSSSPTPRPLSARSLPSKDKSKGSSKEDLNASIQATSRRDEEECKAKSEMRRVQEMEEKRKRAAAVRAKALEPRAAKNKTDKEKEKKVVNKCVEEGREGKESSGNESGPIKQRKEAIKRPSSVSTPSLLSARPQSSASSRLNTTISLPSGRRTVQEERKEVKKESFSKGRGVTNRPLSPAPPKSPKNPLRLTAAVSSKRVSGAPPPDLTIEVFENEKAALETALTTAQSKSETDRVARNLTRLLKRWNEQRKRDEERDKRATEKLQLAKEKERNDLIDKRKLAEAGLRLAEKQQRSEEIKSFRAQIVDLTEKIGDGRPRPITAPSSAATSRPASGVISSVASKTTSSSASKIPSAAVSKSTSKSSSVVHSRRGSQTTDLNVPDLAITGTSIPLSNQTFTTAIVESINKQNGDDVLNATSSTNDHLNTTFNSMNPEDEETY